MRSRLGWLVFVGLAAALDFGLMAARSAAEEAMLLPGTGRKSPKVGDDFEDEKWTYHFNNPKSSHEQDDQIRYPAGGSANGRLSESAKRGHPDVIKRVPTPEGGIPGSQGALQLRTLNSGVPNQISGQNMQDDLIVNVTNRMGGYLPVSDSPSIVVRVYVPPFDQWEQRTGNSFGFRGSVDGYRSYDNKRDTYWPGIFIFFYCKADYRVKESYAQLLLRCDSSGRDFWGPKITGPGWWTLGMSFTSDGKVHYFAHAGVEDLTASDLIASQTPYGFRAERFQSFFFDLVNRDDGVSWSTPWVIDDPSLYYLHDAIDTRPAPVHDEKKNNNQFTGRRGWRW